MILSNTLLAQGSPPQPGLGYYVPFYDLNLGSFHFLMVEFYKNLHTKAWLEGMSTGFLGPTRTVNLPGVVEEESEVKRKGKN